MNVRSAIKAIDSAGILLVFPISNQQEPPSLWSHFFPQKKMEWEWDESGDAGVSDLWHLRAELSTTRKVIYTKWYRNRATYFSLPVFAAILRLLNHHRNIHGCSSDAIKLLKTLEGESPLSTKELKRMADMRRKENEGRYDRALKELWQKLLVVAYGEVDDGAFPSLAIGATSVLFEETFENAFEMKIQHAEKLIEQKFEKTNLFYRFLMTILNSKQVRNKSSTRLIKVSQEQRIAKVISFEDL